MGEGPGLLSAICTGLTLPYVTTPDGQPRPMMITGWQMRLGGFMLLVSGCCGTAALNHYHPSGSVCAAYIILLSAAAFSVWNILIKNIPLA